MNTINLRNLRNDTVGFECDVISTVANNPTFDMVAVFADLRARWTFCDIEASSLVGRLVAERVLATTDGVMFTVVPADESLLFENCNPDVAGVQFADARM